MTWIWLMLLVVMVRVNHVSAIEHCLLLNILYVECACSLCWAYFHYSKAPGKYGIYFKTIMLIHTCIFSEKLWNTLQKPELNEPCFHPFIIFSLSGVGSWWQQTEQGVPNILLPCNAFWLLLGDPYAFPGMMTYDPSKSGRPPVGGTLESSHVDALTISNSPFWCKAAMAPCSLDVCTPQLNLIAQMHRHVFTDYDSIGETIQYSWDNRVLISLNA